VVSVLACIVLFAGCVRRETLPRERATAFGPARLGEVWHSPHLTGAGPGDTIVSLPEGAVAGRGRVTVYRSAAGAVLRIRQDYPQSVDFARLVGDLRRRYGVPIVHDHPADPEAAERVVWEDPRTRLELVRDPRRSVATVHSLLVNRP
jgi:hypothetical protein